MSRRHPSRAGGSAPGVITDWADRGAASRGPDGPRLLKTKSNVSAPVHSWNPQGRDVATPTEGHWSPMGVALTYGPTAVPRTAFAVLLGRQRVGRRPVLPHPGGTRSSRSLFEETASVPAPSGLGCARGKGHGWPQWARLSFGHYSTMWCELEQTMTKRLEGLTVPRLHLWRGPI